MEELALKAALAALRRRDYFEAELRSLLTGKGFEDVEAVISHLSARGILNDERVATNYRLSHSGQGDAKIEEALRRRGYDADVSGAGSSSSVDSGTSSAAGPILVDEIDRARAVLAKKFGDSLEKARAWRFLAGRGFSEETCTEILGGFDD